MPSAKRLFQVLGSKLGNKFTKQSRVEKWQFSAAISLSKSEEIFMGLVKDACLVTEPDLELAANTGALDIFKSSQKNILMERL